MKKEDRKELLEQYKFRKPDMGILAVECPDAGELFLGISKDIKADINSLRFKLMTGSHPNRALVSLWNTYGADKLVFSVLKQHDYDDPSEDQTEALEALLDGCMQDHTNAKYIWRARRR